jgi:hypothetical protein
MHRSTSLQRMIAAGCVAIGLVIAAPGVSAQDKRKASPPVLVTSIGQSLDGFQVQLAVRREPQRLRRRRHHHQGRAGAHRQAA